MTDFSNHVVVVRGGGDIGTGAIWRLRRVGFPVVVLELEHPLTIRRTVAFSSAVTEGAVTIEGVDGVRVTTPSDALDAASRGVVPVLISPGIPDMERSVVVDARLAKVNLDTTLDDAPFVISLGPGFTAGVDCHAIVETMRGHDLGRVIWDGPATPNTGVPGVIGGASADRVLHAETSGDLSWAVSFGDLVETGQEIGQIDHTPIHSKIAGAVRGLLLPGPVTEGLKIADVDPRFDPEAVGRISDKSLSVAGGVLEAILVWLARPAS